MLSSSSPMSSGDQIATLLKSQWGLISSQQVLALGLSRDAIRWRFKTGEWQHGPATGVYRIASSTHAGTWEERLMAACLQGGPDTVASHSSAASLWRLDGFTLRRPEPLQVTIPRGRSLVVPGVDVFVTRTPASKALRSGLPCTTLPRTLADLCLTHPDKVEAAQESAIRTKRIWRLWIRTETDKLPRRHPARARLLALLEERSFTFDSTPEIDVNHLIWIAGLHEGVRVHYPIIEDGRFIGNVDFCWPHLKLFLQFHGADIHLRLDRWRLDLWQVSRLSARGWTPVLTTWVELRHQLDDFIANLQHAHRTCSQRLGLVLGP